MESTLQRCGWEVLSCLRAADLVLEDAVDEDVDEDDLAEWIEILKHVGKCIRGNNTKFERILKAAVTEFSSRYGFIRKQGQGPQLRPQIRHVGHFPPPHGTI